jgi:hypothetical protein
VALGTLHSAFIGGEYARVGPAFTSHPSSLGFNLNLKLPEETSTGGDLAPGSEAWLGYQTEGGCNTRIQDFKEGETVLGVRAIPPSGFYCTHAYEPPLRAPRMTRKIGGLRYAVDNPLHVVDK